MPLNKLNPARSKTHHAQQEPAMAPTIDVCRTVGALAVANGHFGDFEIEAGGAE